MGVVSQKLRDSARGQECTFHTPWCNHNRETTVLAHLRSAIAGMGTKSDDWHAAFACSDCHARYDNSTIPGHCVTFYELRALQRTQKIWRDMGLIVIAGDNEKPRKPSAKILPRKPMTVQP